MDFQLACEARLADHYRTVAGHESAAWLEPARIPRCRVTVAQMLGALSARIAATVTRVSASTRAVAH